MKNFIKIFTVLFMFPLIGIAQEVDTLQVEKVVEKVERPAFESATLIDNQTNVLFGRNTLDVQMQHRFGLIDETNSLAGIYGDGANIRIALSYAILDRLTIGYGTTKNNRLQDFNWKAALLRQTRSNSMPVSVTYYGNFTIDARPESTFNLVQDRYSFFNQLIIAKKFGQSLSLQLAPSYSHYNAVESNMDNDMFSIAFGGRAKISPQTAIIFDYSQPITDFESDPKPGISLGAEFGTSGHTFQIFVTNYSGIVQQKNYMMNQNDFFDGDILLGFNITRRYNF
jgi:hypothetical protein